MIRSQLQTIDSQFKIGTGAVTSTPDCAAQDKTISLGPSPMQSDGARLLEHLIHAFLPMGR